MPILQRYRNLRVDLRVHSCSFLKVHNAYNLKIFLLGVFTRPHPSFILDANVGATGRDLPFYDGGQGWVRPGTTSVFTRPHPSSVLEKARVGATGRNEVAPGRTHYVLWKARMGST